MVITPTQNNLPRPSYSLKKSDWLKYSPPPNAEILLVETAMLDNPYWSKPRPKITFLDQTMASRNLIGLDKQTNKQTLTIFNEPITLSFRKGKN
jgi:hypothetical protein